jgi:hypothetical protein
MSAPQFPRRPQYAECDAYSFFWAEVQVLRCLLTMSSSVRGKLILLNGPQVFRTSTAICTHHPVGRDGMPLTGSCDEYLAFHDRRTAQTCTCLKLLMQEPRRNAYPINFFRLLLSCDYCFACIRVGVNRTLKKNNEKQSIPHFQRTSRLCSVGHTYRTSHFLVQSTTALSATH